MAAQLGQDRELHQVLRETLYQLHLRVVAHLLDVHSNNF